LEAARIDPWLAGISRRHVLLTGHNRVLDVGLRVMT